MPPQRHSAVLRTLSTLSQPHKPTHLLHLHLPGLTQYSFASTIQETIIQRHFAAKDRLRQHGSASSPLQVPVQSPLPLILTFSTPPTYTVGRRYLTSNPLPQSQISFLQGLEPSNPSQKPLAAFNTSPRGGDLTYHAPGQLTAYAIVDLRTHNITPRCYVRLLENTVMRTCARFDVPNTTTTDDPGVWITELASNTDDASSVATDRKICALGVQIRRGITAHGIGLNVHDHAAPPEYITTARNADTSSVLAPEESLTSSPTTRSSQPSPGYLTWGFQRIVACGLEGKTVTWLSREGATPDLRADSVGQAFAEEFAAALGLSGEPASVEARHLHTVDRAANGRGEADTCGGGGTAVREITLRDIMGW